MLRLAEAVTDVAALAVGDLAAVSELFDAPDSRTWTECRDRAVASGALWGMETGADGAYLVALFVD